MMKPRFTPLFASLLAPTFIILWAPLLTAQAESNHIDRFEVFGGFSFVPQDFSLTNPNGGHLFGWNASATFTQHDLGVIIDVSGYYPNFNYGCGAGCGQSAKIHSFLFGPQIFVSRGRLQPFARFLIGDSYMSTNPGATFTSSNSLTFGAGGGVDIGLSHRFAVRGQVDWLHNMFQTSDNQRYNEEHRNVARLSTGLVIRF